ncbi:MAG TPA: hypothetical protein VMV57_10690, partial [Terracidiphilus sp.]|nr:hypothetical protein [Terracidiphilus sp.]
MTPSAALPLSPASFALILGLLLLAPLAIAGLALINTGLGRSRSAAQSLLGSLLTISSAVIAFALLGATFAGGPAAHIVSIVGKPWNLLGAAPLALSHFASAAPREQLGTLFEFLAVALAVLIPWGSGADRLRLFAGAALAAVFAAIVFPLAAHWIWGGGWLAQLGINFSLGAGFLDVGGAATIHVLGGLSALAVIWIAGPRKGKFPREGLSTAIPGHNAIYVLFGCLIALVGWLAFNLAGALLWLSAAPTALPVVAVNTVLSAAAALGATFAVTRLRFGKPDATLCANGWLAGLVTSSACAALVTPLQAVFTGLVAGIVTPLLVELLELALSIDDPSGGLSVHAASGLWGLLAAGLFAPLPGQLIAQLLGVAAILGLLFPFTYLLFALLNRVLPFRVAPDGERLGMDLHELGGNAYPEFVVHRDDSYR